MRAKPIRSPLMAEEGIRGWRAPARGRARTRQPEAHGEALYGACLPVSAQHGRHGLASQAMPYAGRQLRSAACADACRRPAARDALNRDAAPRQCSDARALAAPMRQSVYDLAGAVGTLQPLKALGMREDDRSARPTSPCVIRIGIPAHRACRHPHLVAGCMGRAAARMTGFRLSPE